MPGSHRAQPSSHRPADHSDRRPRRLRTLLAPALLGAALLLVASTARAHPCHECSAEGQPACCLLDFCGAPCDAGLVPVDCVGSDCECSITRCIDPECGSEGERACCALEFLPNCDAGLIEMKGCSGDCSCTDGIFSSSGTCIQPSPCGDEGQRACCTAAGETAPGTSAPCKPGLTEIHGCTGDCFCGKSISNVVDNNVNGLSTGTCVRFEDIDEPEVGYEPIPPGTCHLGICPSTGESCALGPIPLLCDITPPPVSLPIFCQPRACGVDEDCALDFPPLDLAPCNLPACSLRGYADLHMHLFGDIAHGGGILAGAPCPSDGTEYCPEAFDGDPCGNTYCDESGLTDVNHALKQCYGTDRNLVTKADADVPAPTCPPFLPDCGANQFHLDHGPTGDTLGDNTIGTRDGSLANIGAPAFNGWPQWSTTTHQQAYYKWLERAWRGGLRLMVQMAVTNTALCLTNKRYAGVDCNNSMAFVDQQIQAAYDLERFIDQAQGGDGWFKIVLTPSEARQVIAQGKLAVVLGIEVDNLFNCTFPRDKCSFLGVFEATVDECDFGEFGDDTETTACKEPGNLTKSSAQYVRDEVDRYYDMGIRHMFPIHNFDNSFGGAATWQSVIEVGNRAVEGHWYKTRDCSGDGFEVTMGDVTQSLILALGFGDFGLAPVRLEDGSCNEFGLFPLGEVLIEEMMEKGMVIDVDHMSTRALDDTIELASNFRDTPYPLTATHVLFFNRHDEERRHERMRTESQLQALKDLGSMVAVMLKDDALDTGDRGLRTTIDYGPSGVTDDCRHSSMTFAQAYRYAVDKMDGRVGMGSDFNGVAGHFGPRYGPRACGGLENPLLFPGPNDEIDNERGGQVMNHDRLQYPFVIPGFGSFTEQVSGQKIFDYNVDGMAHVGLLPDFVADLRGIGLTPGELEPLMRSAEEYIKMWERARGEVSPADPCDATPGPTQGGGDQTATPTRTPSLTPTVSSTPTITSTPTQTHTPTTAHARIEARRAALSTWRVSSRDNGTVVVVGRIDDSGQGGMIVDRILAGGFDLNVADGDGSFNVTLPLDNCRRRRAAELMCAQTGARRMRFIMVPENRRAATPLRWVFRLRATGLPDSETGEPGEGTNPMGGPAIVSLRRGGAIETDLLSNCRQSGNGTLVCREG